MLLLMAVRRPLVIGISAVILASRSASAQGNALSCPPTITITETKHSDTTIHYGGTYTSSDITESSSNARKTITVTSYTTAPWPDESSSSTLIMSRPNTTVTVTSYTNVPRAAGSGTTDVRGTSLGGAVRVQVVQSTARSSNSRVVAEHTIDTRDADAASEMHKRTERTNQCPLAQTTIVTYESTRTHSIYSSTAYWTSSSEMSQTASVTSSTSSLRSSSTLSPLSFETPSTATKSSHLLSTDSSPNVSHAIGSSSRLPETSPSSFKVSSTGTKSSFLLSTGSRPIVSSSRLPETSAEHNRTSLDTSSNTVTHLTHTNNSASILKSSTPSNRPLSTLETSSSARPGSITLASSPSKTPRPTKSSIPRSSTSSGSSFNASISSTTLVTTSPDLNSTSLWSILSANGSDYDSSTLTVYSNGTAVNTVSLTSDDVAIHVMSGDDGSHPELKVTTTLQWCKESDGTTYSLPAVYKMPPDTKSKAQTGFKHTATTSLTITEPVFNNTYTFPIPSGATACPPAIIGWNFHCGDDHRGKTCPGGMCCGKKGKCGYDKSYCSSNSSCQADFGHCWHKDEDDDDYGGKVYFKFIKLVFGVIKLRRTIPCKLGLPFPFCPPGGIKIPCPPLLHLICHPNIWHFGCCPDVGCFGLQCIFNEGKGKDGGGCDTHWPYCPPGEGESDDGGDEDPEDCKQEDQTTVTHTTKSCVKYTQKEHSSTTCTKTKLETEVGCDLIPSKTTAWTTKKCTTTVTATDRSVSCDIFTYSNSDGAVTSTHPCKTKSRVISGCDVTPTTTTVLETCSPTATATERSVSCEIFTYTNSNGAVSRTRPCKTHNTLVTGCDATGTTTTVHETCSPTVTFTDYTHFCVPLSTTSGTITASCSKTSSEVTSGCSSAPATTTSWGACRLPDITIVPVQVSAPACVKPNITIVPVNVTEPACVRPMMTIIPIDAPSCPLIPEGIQVHSDDDQGEEGGRETSCPMLPGGIDISADDDQGEDGPRISSCPMLPGGIDLNPDDDQGQDGALTDSCPRIPSDIDLSAEDDQGEDGNFQLKTPLKTASAGVAESLSSWSVSFSSSTHAEYSEGESRLQHWTATQTSLDSLVNISWWESVMANSQTYLLPGVSGGATQTSSCVPGLSGRPNPLVQSCELVQLDDGFPGCRCNANEAGTWSIRYDWTPDIIYGYPLCPNQQNTDTECYTSFPGPCSPPSDPEIGVCMKYVEFNIPSDIRAAYSIGSEHNHAIGQPVITYNAADLTTEWCSCPYWSSQSSDVELWPVPTVALTTVCGGRMCPNQIGHVYKSWYDEGYTDMSDFFHTLWASEKSSCYLRDLNLGPCTRSFNTSCLCQRTANFDGDPYTTIAASTFSNMPGFCSVDTTICPNQIADLFPEIWEGVTSSYCQVIPQPGMPNCTMVYKTNVHSEAFYSGTDASCDCYNTDYQVWPAWTCDQVMCPNQHGDPVQVNTFLGVTVPKYDWFPTPVSSPPNSSSFALPGLRPSGVPPTSTSEVLNLSPAALNPEKSAGDPSHLASIASLTHLSRTSLPLHHTEVLSADDSRLAAVASNAHLSRTSKVSQNPGGVLGSLLGDMKPTKERTKKKSTKDD